jgi:hypothetical protein
MAEVDFGIIRALIESKGKELTIHQISCAIKKSYAYTNKYAHILIKKNILKGKEVGSSILCSVNFSSEAAIASLVYISMLKKAGLNQNEKMISTIDKYSNLGIIFYFEGRLCLITDKSLKASNIISLSRESFIAQSGSFDLSDLVVLTGHESFWKLMARVMP